MMHLTPADIEKVKEYAALFMSLDDIAVLINQDPEEIKTAFQDKSGEFYRAYRSGQVNAKLTLRRPVIKMAGLGSPQAEILADKYLNEQLLSETDG